MLRNHGYNEQRLFIFKYLNIKMAFRNEKLIEIPVFCDSIYTTTTKSQNLIKNSQLNKTWSFGPLIFGMYN